MTKRVFKDTIKSLRSDPSFLAELVEVIHDTMPDNLSEYVAKQQYLKRAYDQPYYIVTDLIHGTKEYCATQMDVVRYIQSKYPSATKGGIQSCIHRGHRAHNHDIKKVEPTEK